MFVENSFNCYPLQFESWPYTREKLSGINGVNEFGRTRLMVAVEESSSLAFQTRKLAIAKARELLDAGVDPNIEAVFPRNRDSYWRSDVVAVPFFAAFTALIGAVQKDNLEMARLLLAHPKNPADPNLETHKCAGSEGTFLVRPRGFAKTQQMHDLLTEFGATPDLGEWHNYVIRRAKAQEKARRSHLALVK